MIPIGEGIGLTGAGMQTIADVSEAETFTQGLTIATVDAAVEFGLPTVVETVAKKYLKSTLPDVNGDEMLEQMTKQADAVLEGVATLNGFAAEKVGETYKDDVKNSILDDNNTPQMKNPLPGQSVMSPD